MTELLPRNIFLVRHAQSMSNVNKDIHHEIADHAIPLSEEGEKQAARAGAVLNRWLTEYLAKEKHNFSLLPRSQRPCDQFYFKDGLQTRVWTSPYKRTRQTAAAIASACSEHIRDVKEHILLCEQQFGLFDGLDDDELQAAYPSEWEHYSKCERFEGRFWARMPLGESRFDVARRVHQAFGTFHRDRERHDVRNIIVICHGVTQRAFRMMWQHYPFEWFDETPNPKNCSIFHIQNGEDKGFIFPGFD